MRALYAASWVPERVVAAVLRQPIGHRPETPDVMYDLSRDVAITDLPTDQPD